MINTSNYIDMTGKTIGLWTVLYRSKNNKYGQVMWHCRCICGNEKDILGGQLRRNSPYSCGCVNKNKSKNKWDLSGDFGIGYDNQGRPFYFDIEDFDIINKYYWRVHQHEYVSTSIYDPNTKKITQIQLHRLIMNPLPEQEVDHINHIPYDNRKSNLRITTTAQNQMNSIISSRNTSGVKGVNWSKSENKWYARISVDGRRIELGYYFNFADAVKARKEAEIKYYRQYQYKGDDDNQQL